MTSFKDDKCFRSLDNDRWEDLCYFLFKQEFVGLHRVDGSGGDEGIDAYVGTFDSPRIVFQFKFFPGGFGKGQITQIKRSLGKVLETRPGLRRWILICSAEPTPQACRALDGLIAEHPEVDIEVLTEGDVKSKLLRHPTVRRRYYDEVADVLKSVLALSDLDPVKRAIEGVKTYSESIVDERFVATVVTDGKSTMTTYSLHPGFLDTPPTFTLRIKSKRGADALSRLVRFGTPIHLLSEDVELDDSDLPGLGVNDGEFQSLKITPHIDPRLSQLRFYAPDEKGGSQTIFMELCTTSEGTERIIRSNSGQKNAPVIFELVLIKTANDAVVPERSTIKLTPHLVGNRVSIALKGAHFLAQLSKARRLGFSSADGDVGDASFISLDSLDDGGVWAQQLAYIEAIDRICRFFGIDPIIDDTLNDEEFFRFVMRFDARARTVGNELEGTTTFEFCEPTPDLIGYTKKRETINLVSDMDWSGSIFGCEVSARIRVVATGVPSVEAVGDDRWILTVKGSYQCYIGKDGVIIGKNGAPPVPPALTQG